MNDQDMLGLPGAARAFEPGAEAQDRRYGAVTFWTRSVGDLIAPTGRIVACDPFECVDAPAFAHKVLPGHYPVRVALAQFAGTRDERIAGAVLQLRDAAPVRWESAEWVRDADTANAEADKEGATVSAPLMDAYGVDSGFSSFMDEAAIEALLDHIEAEDDDDYLQGRLDRLGPVGGPEWFDLPLDETNGANILLFTSGWGDGVYPSYWGYAADDGLVCLLTDFGVVDASDFL
ncbi:MAG TPA: DUF4241 domain-containing protein [Ktedonobacterales bacterium]|jgi:hypothetical protein